MVLMDEDDLKMIVLVNIEDVLVQLMDFFHGFLFRNNICSTVLGLSRFLFLEITSPALENTLTGNR